MKGLQRIRVESVGESEAADRLRAQLFQAGYTLVADDTASLAIVFHEDSGHALTLDSVDSPLEARLLANLEELVRGPVQLHRAGGNRDATRAVITLPPAQAEVVAKAVFRAIEQVSTRPVVPPADPTGTDDEPEVVRLLRGDNRQLQHLLRRAMQEREAKILEQQARFEVIDLLNSRLDARFTTLIGVLETRLDARFAAWVETQTAVHQAARSEMVESVTARVEAMSDALSQQLRRPWWTKLW